MKHLLLLLCFVFLASCNNSKATKVSLSGYHNTEPSFVGKSYKTQDSVYAYPKLKPTESLLNLPFDFKNPKIPEVPFVVTTIKGGNYQATEIDRFVIGLIDFNNNGIFNETETDQLFVAPYNSKKAKFSSYSNSWFGKLKEQNIIEVNNKYFEITNIDTSGEFLEIIETERPEQEPLFKSITNLNTNFELVNEAGKTVNSTEIFNNKPLYFELWYEGCAPCIRALKHLDTIDRTTFDVVGVNAIDGLPSVQTINKHYNLSLNQYKLTDSLLSLLGNKGGYPSAIYYNERGELVNQYYNFDIGK